MVCMETMLDTQMPTWMPPSPPSSESGLFDVYVDGALECLYESELMTDDRLPSIVLDLPKFPTFNKPETEQQRIQSNNHSTVDEAIDSVRKSAKQAMLAVTEKRDTSSTGPPQSRTLFDSRNRQDLRKTLSPPPPFKEDEQYEGPEWSIIEDYALLMAITREQQMTYNLLTGKAGHVPNWDYVAGLINRISGHYRSPRQCSLRYQLAVLPREEGRLVAFDPVSKKARKVHLSQTEVVHMKRGRTTTAQQFEADGQKLFGARAAQRFRSLRAVAPYLAPFKRCTAHLSLIGRLPTLQERLPPFQDTRLASFGIRYSTVIQPLEQAEYRDERRSRQPVAESVARLEQPLSKRLPEHSPANESRAQLVPLRQPALASAGILPPPSAVRPPLPGTIGPLGSSSHSGGVQQISEGHLVSALVDHHQMQMNAASIRRQISNSSLSSSQNSQQSISFMVTQEGTQPSQSRMPYAGRPDGSTPYRAIVPQTGKPVRTPPSTPLPVGFAQSNLPTSSSGAQVYTGTMTAVRSSGEEVGQVQLMRPQLQPAIAPSNIRPKMTMGMGTQRVNRVILTTTSGAQGNAYLVPQGQPMRSGGQQRMVAQKRNAPLSSKASTSSQPASFLLHLQLNKKMFQVTTLMLQNPRGATMQQMRNMPRHQMPGTSQTTPGRIPSIGLLMSNARGEAPSQQIRIQQQTRGVNQPSPHLLVAQAQRQEALPPISLSTPLPLPPSPRPPPSSTNQP